MARDFPCEPLDLEIPLGTTWEESWALQDDDGAPLDLTGYEFRMMVRARDAAGTLLLTITSEAGPDQRATIDAEQGTIAIRVDALTVAQLSPTNAKLRTRWDAELFMPSQAPLAPYVIPVLAGSATFTSRQTRPVPA